MRGPTNIKYFVAVVKEHGNEGGIVQNVENFFITWAIMFLGITVRVFSGCADRLSRSVAKEQ